MPIPSPGELPAGSADAREAPDDPRPRLAERRERQRQDARRTILDATEALMIEKSGSDFSIRALGERSGYSAPSISPGPSGAKLSCVAGGLVNFTRDLRVSHRGTYSVNYV